MAMSKAAAVISRRDDSLERQAIETALATVYALMTDASRTRRTSSRVTSTTGSSATSTSHSTSPAAGARPTRTIHGDVERAGDLRVG